jgi:hypothetical protein
MIIALHDASPATWLVMTGSIADLVGPLGVIAVRHVSFGSARR